jgi:hypothetical protein
VGWGKKSTRRGDKNYLGVIMASINPKQTLQLSTGVYCYFASHHSLMLPEPSKASQSSTLPHNFAKAFLWNTVASAAFPSNHQKLCFTNSHMRSSDDDCVASTIMDDDKEDSSASESETLALHCKNAAAKKRKGKKAAPAVRPKKKKNGKAKSPPIQVPQARSLAYDTDELLLLVKAFMTASCNVKQSTEKKADKFWEEISQQFEELIAMANKLKEKNSG